MVAAVSNGDVPCVRVVVASLASTRIVVDHSAQLWPRHTNRLLDCPVGLFGVWKGEACWPWLPRASSRLLVVEVLLCMTYITYYYHYYHHYYHHHHYYYYLL